MILTKLNSNRTALEKIRGSWKPHFGGCKCSALNVLTISYVGCKHIKKFYHFYTNNLLCNARCVWNKIKNKLIIFEHQFKYSITYAQICNIQEMKKLVNNIAEYVDQLNKLKARKS